MTIKSPLYLEDLVYSATDDRRLITALLPGAGVILSGDLAVAQHSTGNMSVDVAAGSAGVTGTALAGQGNYLFTSTAVVNLTIATAPGSGQSRIDLIVATIEDQDQDGGSNNQGVLQVVKGTAASTGSQVAPSVPASSLVLAHIAVGPSVTSILTANITDERSFATTLSPAVPAARIYQTSAQTIPNNALTALTSFTNDYNQGGINTNALAGTITVGETGLYHIDGQVEWNVSSQTLVGHRFEAFLILNGSTTLIRAQQATPEPSAAVDFPASSAISLPFSADLRLSASDVLSIDAFHNDNFTTTSLPTNAGSAGVFLSARFVSS